MIGWGRRGLAAACLALLAASAAAQQPDAEELMRRNFYATKVSGFTGEITMTLTNDRGEQRVRKMSVRSKLKANGVDVAILTRFRQPADIKGTGFLQIENSAGDDDIWIYLPALGRTRRLASNNKRDSFFGTDFSYGDILLPAVEKYRHALLRTESVDGADCHVIESTPIDARTRDDSGYGRRLTWIDSRSYVERKVAYYDTNNALLKTQLVFEIREVEPARQRWTTMRRQMTNHQTGHKTLYLFDRFDLDRSLQDAWFSTRRLEEQ
jgi:outer membrane lipoprotein-sorting protein